MKELMLSVPDKTHSAELEDFILYTLGFDIQGVGCGSAEYIGKGNVGAIRSQLKANFGNVTRKITVERTEDLYESEI